MVLFSEYIVGVVAVLFFFVSLYQYINEGEEDRMDRGRNHATLFTAAMMPTYAATRVLLESESAQSVVPLFLAAAVIISGTLKRCRYYPLEWILRYVAVHVTVISLFLYIMFEGLGPIAMVAAKSKFDRQLQWYHVLFVIGSSWRWFILNLVVALPVCTKGLGCVAMLVKIAVVWVMCLATGKSVAPSPWGVYDEILLEKNSLIYLILGLISFAIAMDQVCAEIVYIIKIGEIRDHARTHRLSWEEVKEIIFHLRTSVSDNNDQPSSRNNESATIAYGAAGETAT